MNGVITKSIGSWLVKACKVIAGAVIIIATTAVCAALGSTLVPLVGGVMGGFAGFYFGVDAAHSLFPSIFPPARDLV